MSLLLVNTAILLPYYVDRNGKNVLQAHYFSFCHSSPVACAGTASKDKIGREIALCSRRRAFLPYPTQDWSAKERGWMVPGTH